jgi:hypothetical protein
MAEAQHHLSVNSGCSASLKSFYSSDFSSKALSNLNRTHISTSAPNTWRMNSGWLRILRTDHLFFDRRSRPFFDELINISVFLVSELAGNLAQKSSLPDVLVVLHCTLLSGSRVHMQINSHRLTVELISVSATYRLFNNGSTTFFYPNYITRGRPYSMNSSTFNEIQWS